jgi:hypothetical protein
MLCLKNQGQNNFKWINYVESILNRAGLGNIFINQVGYCDRTYLNQILTDQFVSSWYNDIEIHLEDNFMALSKKTGLENYLVRLNEKTRIWMTKLRASNLRIPIELGGGIIFLKMRGFELYVDNQLVMSSTCYLLVVMNI